MKHLIIYHAHCNDGFGAAWAVWKAWKTELNEIELHAASYGKEPPYEKITKDTVVHIVDFSYPPVTMLAVCLEANSVVWVDHHKTALDAWNDYRNEEYSPMNLSTSLDDNYSGAMLAWRYYHAGMEAPRILKHIQDRDLWRFEMRCTKEVHLNLNTQPKDMEHWDNMINWCELSDTFDSFVREGAAIKRYYDQLIQNILATNKVEVFIDGVRGLACNCPGALASDLGHILANESGTYGFTWEETSKGNEKCSLRSNGDYDISVIAKSFGGGGHKNAAGFVIDPPDDVLGKRIKFKPL